MAKKPGVSVFDFTSLAMETEEALRQFLEKHDAATPFHSLEWNQALCAGFPGIKQKLFLAQEKGELVGVYPLYYFEEGEHFIGMSPPQELLSVYGGPLAENNRQEIIEALILAAEKESGKARFVLKFSPDYGGETAFKRLNYLWGKGPTSVIDLKQGKEKLWQGLDKKARNQVRNAERQGLETRAIGRKELKEYYALVEQTYQRVGLKILPEKFYEAVFDRLAAKGRVEFLVASRQGQAAAGALFLKFRKKAYYLEGVSDKECWKLNGNTLLQWRFMEKASQEGLFEYDLLGLDIPSIAKFKESFGGRKTEYFTARKELDKWNPKEKVKAFWPRNKQCYS
jgi:hypothetical protein